MLIRTSQFCLIVGMGPDRFEQRRLRERAASDAAEATGDIDFVAMPIAPSGYGHRAGYDAFDAVKLRAVLLLEQSGLHFGAGCRLLRGVGPDVMFENGADVFAGSWLDDGHAIRRVVGTRQELARATPESPLAAIKINLTAVRDDVARRARERLGLTLAGTRFQREASR